MLGGLSALGSALAFALGSTFTTSLSQRMSVFSLNGWRAFFSSLLFLLALVGLGKWGDLAHMPVSAMIAFLGSLLIGMALGGTLYVQSLKIIGLSRAMPIVSTQPLFASLIAILLLGEALSWGLVFSTPLVIVGVWLLALPPERASLGKGAAGGQANPRAVLLGVGMALATALSWAVASSLIKSAVAQADLLAANLFRMGILAFILLGFAGPRRSAAELRGLDGKGLAMLLIAALLENGASSSLYIFAVRESGVARTAVLSATAPLFSLPLGLILLKERITAKKVLGTLACTLGIAFVFL